MSDDHYTVLKAPYVGDGDSSQDSMVASMNAILVGSPVAPSLETSSILPLSADVSFADDSSVELEFVVPPSPVGS